MEGESKRVRRGTEKGRGEKRREGGRERERSLCWPPSPRTWLSSAMMCSSFLSWYTTGGSSGNRLKDSTRSLTSEHRASSGGRVFSWLFLCVAGGG